MTILQRSVGYPSGSYRLLYYYTINSNIPQINHITVKLKLQNPIYRALINCDMLISETLPHSFLIELLKVKYDGTLSVICYTYYFDAWFATSL